MTGICDSGVGGLIVYQKLRGLRPAEQYVYLADQAYAPYGERTQPEIAGRMKQVAAFFVEHGATVVVIACNTATVNAVDALRTAFPDIAFVGMEPAVKPAAAVAGKIVVLGTNSTVGNARYRALVDRVAAGKSVWHVGAPELVRQVEAGELGRADQLRARLQPFVDQGAEAVVVGCSHFSFLVPTITRIWPGLRVFDGADGTAKRAASLLADEPSATGRPAFFTTGPATTVTFLPKPIAFAHTELPAE